MFGYTIAQCKIFIKMKEDFQRIAKLSEEPINLQWEELVTYCRIISSQQYGPIFQERFKVAMGWMDRSLCGDAQDENNKKIEIKTSLLTYSNLKPNIRQIRLYEPIDYYYVFIIDQSNNLSVYKLTHEQMEFEVEMSGQSCTHPGDGDKNGKNKEYNVDFREDWNTLYKIDNTIFVRNVSIKKYIFE